MHIAAGRAEDRKADSYWHGGIEPVGFLHQDSGKVELHFYAGMSATLGVTVVHLFSPIVPRSLLIRY